MGSYESIETKATRGESDPLSQHGIWLVAMLPAIIREFAS